MSGVRTHAKSLNAVVQAPAETVFALITELRYWPQFFPNAVHAEPQDAAGEVIRWWALEGETVHQWSSRRRIDRAALTVVSEQLDCLAPFSGVRTEWTLEPRGADECTAVLRLTVETSDESAATATAALNRLAQAEDLFARVKAVAERWEDLQELVISFEDPLFIAGDPDDVYEFLYAADKWPERVPHVTALTMTEDQPGVQFFDMDTVTPEGRAHTTRSVRICLPERIVYKQINLPKLLDAHTGHWHFVQTPEGVMVTARHTATIKRGALNLLGEGTTVTDARRYLRRVLSTNSLQTLRHAQAFAEEPAYV